MNPLKRIHIAFCDIGLSPKKKEKPKKNMRKTQMVQLLERTTRGVGKSLNQDVAEKGKCCPPSPSGTSGEEDPFPVPSAGIKSGNGHNNLLINYEKPWCSQQQTNLLV
ncbi:hypothetical protein RUM43_014805 [Polyplax serrata]|uniref:Uncharacterized protein n=1 Tax=Polyplax serrata TaxID=468196 RepID=A0AAN8S3G5_POLSC